MIASPSSASALYVYYRTISLRCHMCGLLDNGIYGVERFLEAMANKALTRMACQPPAFGGRVIVASMGIDFSGDPDGSAHLRQRRLGLGQPERHVHGAIQLMAVPARRGPAARWPSVA